MPHPRAYLQVLTLASRQPAVLRTAATPAAVAAQVGLQAMLVYCVRAATRTWYAALAIRKLLQKLRMKTHV